MTTQSIGQGGKRRARADREKQILDILSRRWLPYSTHGLAKACGMTNSPHFKTIVKSMMVAGKIEGYRSQKANGMDVYYWYHPRRDELHGQQKMVLK